MGLSSSLALAPARFGVGFPRSSTPAPVIFAIPKASLGGAQCSLILLLRALDRTTFPPLVVLGEEGPLGQTLRALDVSVELLNVPFRSPRAIAPFVAIARRHGARILHLYGARTLALAARALGLFVVERVNLLRSREAGGLVACPFLDRALIRLAHRVIVPSRAMQDQLVARGIPASRMRLVPNGVCLEPPARGRTALRGALGVPTSAFVILSLARLVPMKGLDVLLDAFALILRDRPLTWLLLAGEGPERDRLEARARALPGVRFLGGRTDVPDLLLASDALVQASRSEVLSNAVLEAMAAGCPVVATDVGGTREVVSHGETGLLVAPGDAPALAGALIELASAPERRRQVAATARERVAAPRSVEVMARATEAVYRDLLARERVGGPRTSQKSRSA